MLKGRTAFVTGGTGAIGSAIVRSLAAHGAQVGFSFHTQEDKARALERELVSPGTAGPTGTAAIPAGPTGTARIPTGPTGSAGIPAGSVRVKAYPLNVLDKANSLKTAEQVERELGPVDILVNNAGITQVMPFALIEEEDWDRMMDVNVKGMFLVTKAFVRGMIRRKQGAVVNLGSLAGMRVLEVPVHYATAKSAVVGFTLSLARELSRYNVRVNAVVPGLLEGGVSSNVPDKQREDYFQHCTVGRAGKPEEVAELVAFLASVRASYINAQAIHIDGGV